MTKIIIERGFEKRLSKAVILRNGQQEATLGIGRNCYEINAQDADNISVKLNGIGLFPTPAAQFTHKAQTAGYHITPTMLLLTWELINYRLLPYLCIILMAFNIIYKNAVWGSVCATAVVSLLLSLFSLQILLLLPLARKLFFKVGTL